MQLSVETFIQAGGLGLIGAGIWQLHRLAVSVAELARDVTHLRSEIATLQSEFHNARSRTLAR